MEVKGGGPMIESLVNRLTGKESQVDLLLRHVVLELKGTPFALELNGLVTVAAHLRELTEAEKGALAAGRVAKSRE